MSPINCICLVAYRLSKEAARNSSAASAHMKRLVKDMMLYHKKAAKEAADANKAQVCGATSLHLHNTNHSKHVCSPDSRQAGSVPWICTLANQADGGTFRKQDKDVATGS